MRIIGTGVDITENQRFEKMLDNREIAFFERVFTEVERDYCDKYRGNAIKAQHYAARFAAKEALVKALGTGFRKMSFHDLEVQNNHLGAPYFVIGETVQSILADKGVEKIHLSLSHSDHYSIGFVILEGKGLGECE